MGLKRRYAPKHQIWDYIEDMYQNIKYGTKEKICTKTSNMGLKRRYVLKTEQYI